MMLDIDDSKGVNESFGCLLGDRVLLSKAQVNRLVYRLSLQTVNHVNEAHF